MGLFSRFFGKNEQVSQSPTGSSSHRGSPAAGQPAKESTAQKSLIPDPASFGLSRSDPQGQWLIEGRFLSEFANDFHDPPVAAGLVRELQSRLGFDRVCLLAGPPIHIVTNSKPPIAMRTALTGTSAMADLIKAFTALGSRTVISEGLVFVNLSEKS